MSNDQVYVANTTFSTDFEGAAIVVHAGRDRVRATHPLYLQCPSLFDPIDDHVRYDVETAAATPGVPHPAPAPSTAPPSAPTPSSAPSSPARGSGRTSKHAHTGAKPATGGKG